MLLLEHVIQTLLSFVMIIVHQDDVWEYVCKILHMIWRYFLLTVQVKKGMNVGNFLNCLKIWSLTKLYHCPTVSHKMEQKRESVKMTGGKTHSSCWGKKPPLYKRVPCVSCTETISISAVFLHRGEKNHFGGGREIIKKKKYFW